MKNKLLLFLMLIIFGLALLKGGREPIVSLTFSVLVLIIFIIIHKKRKIRLSSLNIIGVLLIFSVFISLFYTVYYYSSLLNFIVIFSLFCIYLSLQKIIKTEQYKPILLFIFLIGIVYTTIGYVQIIKHSQIKGLFTNPAHLGEFIALCIPIGLLNAFSERKRSITAFYYIITTFMFLILLPINSRSAFLSLFLMLIISILLYPQKPKKMILLSFLLILIGLGIINFKKMSKLYNIDPYKGKRTNVWISSLKIIKEKPFFGIGIGNFKYGFLKHNFGTTGTISKFGKFAQFAHNEFLNIGAETGIIGMILLILFFIIFYKEILKEKEKSFSTMLSIICVSGILCQSMFDFNLHLPIFSVVLIFLITIGIRKQINEESLILTRFFSVFSLILIIITTALVLSEIFYKKGNYPIAQRLVPFNSTYYLKTPSIDNLKKAMKFDPLNASLHKKLADTYFNNNNLMHSLYHYKQAIRLSPYNAFYYFSLGAYYYNRKEYKNALSVFKKATHLERNFLKARFYLAKCYQMLNQEELALKEFYNILQLNDIINSLYEPHLKYEKALIEFDLSLVHLELARYWNSRKNYEQAIIRYNKAIKINPKLPDAFNELAHIYFLKENYKKAKSYLEKALALNPKNKGYKKNLEKLNYTIEQNKTYE